MSQQAMQSFTLGTGFLRGMVHRMLRQIEYGTVILSDSGGRFVFGTGAPVVNVSVHDPAFYRQLAFGGSVGAAESYMASHWDCDGLVNLVRIMACNSTLLGELDGTTTAPGALLASIAHAMRRNTLTGSRRNIEAHYDLGDDFFRLFLDKRMMYSAAVYDTGQESLEEASEAKLLRICRKLNLQAEDHLLEIGTGWGGLATFAAERFGCRVTTTTISKAQYEYAKALVANRGLSRQVDVLHADYRTLSGQYDKLASVEMVEAVGHQYLKTYFETCARLLRRHGLLAIQAIVIRDANYRRALKNVDFIKQYIFPGGFMPSNSVLTDAAGAADLTLVNLEDFGGDYALTLREWNKRLTSNWDEASQLGFDERFLRMWHFYFAYCEGGFLERTISDVQMLFAMPEYRGQAWRATGERFVT